MNAIFAPRALAAALATAVATAAHAGAPLYHLTPLTVPDATSVAVTDLNDVGQAVGTYSDQDFVRHAVLWDQDGWHELALPDVGGEIDGIAYAINDAGQIVGTADDFVNPTLGLLWDAGNTGQYTVINDDTSISVRPADISNAGIVVGGFDVPSRAFVWTPETGVVDYGIEDPDVPDQQARWASINDSGTIVGVWNQHVSNIHATIGQVGTAAVLPIGTMTEDFPTNAVEIADDGTIVGLGLAESSANLVPVVIAGDGTYTEIPGATLDQPNGSAIAVNADGVIVGTAGIGTANGPVPGLQAFVYRDGAAYDLYASVDDTGGFARFANAVAINADGVIVGTGRLADDSIASFMLTPIVAESIFADGFDP